MASARRLGVVSTDIPAGYSLIPSQMIRQRPARPMAIPRAIPPAQGEASAFPEKNMRASPPARRPPPHRMFLVKSGSSVLWGETGLWSAMAMVMLARHLVSFKGSR